MMSKYDRPDCTTEYDGYEDGYEDGKEDGYEDGLKAGMRKCAAGPWQSMSEKNASRK